MKTGTFGKSARFHVPKNSTSGAETKKPRPLFVANYPPKWCRTRLFYAFIIFGWVLSQFSKIAHFLSFLRRFYCYMGEKLKLPGTKEDGLKSKNARKQTSFKIQFYIGIKVTSFDFQKFYNFGPNSPSPNVHCAPSLSVSLG